MERIDRSRLQSLTNSVIDERLPQNPTWQWQEWNGLPYLTCTLLQDWPHGFFTRQYYPRSPEEFVGALDSQATVYRVQQVHGARVLTSTEIEDSKQGTADGDGMITEGINQAIWVASADCTPVLIGDRQTGRVAAIHAGWRGTAKKIVPEAIERLLSFGSDLDNLSIALGPAITGEVYQVSEQVAAEVGASLFPEAENKGLILEQIFCLPDSPLGLDLEVGRMRLDVRRVIFHQLRQLGIDEHQIAIAPFCTYQQPDYFFSYRRDQAKKVQWSGIISR